MRSTGIELAGILGFFLMNVATWLLGEIRCWLEKRHLIIIGVAYNLIVVILCCLVCDVNGEHQLWEKVCACAHAPDGDTLALASCIDSHIFKL